MDSIKTFIAITLMFLIWPHNGHAYLDAGTGSYVVQLIVAGLLGGAFAIKIFWKQMSTSFKKIFSRNQPDEQNKN